MTRKSDKAVDVGDMELLRPADLPRDADSILNDVAHYFGRMLGRRTIRKKMPFLYQAVVLAIRDRLMERWGRTRTSMEIAKSRRVSYLSLEFLMGRLLQNALLNLQLEPEMRDALKKIGLHLEDVYDREHDAGLGNGGLGRLAACFLDSCATLRLPVLGYGIRYQYGMFRQHIENGYQVEEPDPWLQEGFPWEVKRFEFAQIVKFGGYCSQSVDSKGVSKSVWSDTQEVLAIPYDIPVPGYRNGVVNTLRLWSSAATDEFDLQEFNSGSYADAVAAKNMAEKITMVLYPNTATDEGHELRLRQQYFLTSASLQDTLRYHVYHHDDNISNFAEKNCLQLNDTHPAIAVAELMRLLIDNFGEDWDSAWKITRESLAYTNHTLLPEALEVWPVALFRHLLPRLLDIIFDINSAFLEEVADRWPGDEERIRRMSLVQEGDEPMIRMAYLAIVGSASVNGVAALHTKLLTDGLFRDFAEMSPEKFNNKTNGVTQRRWLAACNPGLSNLINENIGDGWVTDLDQLHQLAALANDAAFQNRWRQVKQENKSQLAEIIEDKTGIVISNDMLYDVQVKRIHEYKRQLLNLLHAIYLFNRICRNETVVPRVKIIGGKAAPGYDMAKSIIKCINDVAKTINSDERTDGKLRLIYYPDYNVSAMEAICPATDLSEQISTAGKEASGTGNMKFMMNGAITIGTLDGANVEIRDAVGDDNFFLFGMKVDEIPALRDHYEPDAIISNDEDFGRIMEMLENGTFNRNNPGAFEPIIRAIRDPDDEWLTAADFRSFIEAQNAAADCYRDIERWTHSSIMNCACSGQFSTDRTIRDYNRDIWRVEPITNGLQ